MSAISERAKARGIAPAKRGGAIQRRALQIKQKKITPVAPRRDSSVAIRNAQAQAKQYEDAAKKANSVRGLASNTAKGVAASFIKAPVKFAISAYEAPKVAINAAQGRGYTNKEYNVPGLGKTTSYQTDFGKVADEVVAGKKGLGSAAIELAKVPLAGLETAGLPGVAKSIKGGISLVRNGRASIPKSIPTVSRGKTGGQRQAIVPVNAPLKSQVSPTRDLSVPAPGRIKSNGSVELKSSYPQSLSQNSKNVNRGFVETVKKSSMTDPEVAKAVSGTYTPRETDELVKNVNKLITSNIDEARDLALNGTNDDSVATAMELIKHYQNKGDFDSAVEIAENVAPKLTEAGRAIQAASIYNRLTPEGILRYAAKEVQKHNKLNPARQISLTADDAKRITDLSKKAQGLEGDAKAIATQQMLDEVGKLIPSSGWQQLATVWKAGLLTNPATQVANITGNTTMLALENLKDIPATFFDKLISIGTGQRTKALPSLGAQGKGMLEGFGKAGQFLKTGIDPEDVLSKVDYKKVNLPPGLQQYTDAVFRSLGAGDKIFRQTFFKKSIAELAKVDGINRGLRGEALTKHIGDVFENPPVSFIEQATKDALYGTFNSNNALGQGARGLKKSLGAAGEYIIPFTQTPTNVAARIVDYSPFGFAKAGLQGYGGAGQRAVSESLGRATLGTGLGYGGFELGKNGLYTGSLPSDETERNLWELQGKTPNSILIGGKYYNLDKISPLGYILAGGANLAQGSATGLPGVGEASLQTIKGLKDMTFLQGMSNVINAFDDPKRYGQNLLSSQISSFIPAIVAASARQADPIKRDVKGEGVFDGIENSVMNRIPGLKDNLPAKRDSLGNELQYEGNQFFNPFKPSTARTDSVTQELGRLEQMGGKIGLTEPSREFSFAGSKTKLTPEEYDVFQKDAGGLIRQSLEKVIQKPEYQKLNPEDQVKLIKKIIEQTRQMTGARTIGKDKLTEQLKEYLQNKQLNPFYTQ